MHAIARLAAGVLLVAACNSQKPQTSGGSAQGRPNTGSSTMSESDATPPTTPPRSTLEQVQRWAPAGHTVGAVELAVPGVDVFMVSPPSGPVPADGVRPYAIVAVAGGAGGKLLERDEVVRAAIGATKDAAILARLAMLVSRKQGELLLGATTDEQRKAKVTAPAIAGNAVEFWVWTTGVGRMLERGRLDLSTAAIAYGPPPVGQDDAVANAIAALAGTSISMHAMALKTLGGACASDPKARQALLDTLAGHTRDDTRAAAADASPACGAAAVDALIKAMEQDKSNTVRWKAATALGAIGDAKARPALEKAAKSDSPELQYAAKQALGKLK
jgi:hypothetical protein